MNSKDDGLLTAICQGLSAYQAYLATCNMHTVRSEYLFYEPIARISQARGWTAKCEYKVESISTGGKGDYRRVDFVFEKTNYSSIAVEVKYLRRETICCKKSLENLGASQFEKFSCYLLILGKYQNVHSFKPKLNDSAFKVAKLPRRKIGMASGGIQYAATWFLLE